MGFDELFPIQAEAIAPILKGRDLIGQAHTGSGKTLAYAVPMLQNIRPEANGIQGLVLAPTRELAEQVAGEFAKLARHLRIRAVPVYGGQSINLQIDRLQDPRAKIIVATPGRLTDHMERRTDRLAQALHANRYDAMAIHGDLSQRQRDMAIQAFRTGKTGLLIATDVAARGLDIPKVSHVINYDMPEEPGMYFHRIGRTARAGRRGIAISFLTREDWAVFEGLRRMTSATLDEISPPDVPGLNIPRIHLPGRPMGGGGRRPPRRYDQRGRSRGRRGRW